MSTDDGENGPHLGAMLRVVWQRVRDEVQADVARAGYDDLSNAHLQVFRYPNPDGMRPSELAARLQISKQSVNDLVRHLEQSGYLVLEPDPMDGRARCVRLTAKGRRLARTVDDAARAAELRVGELLGPRRSAELRGILEALARELGDVDAKGARQEAADRRGERRHG